jgi:hypothetical protein
MGEECMAGRPGDRITSICSSDPPGAIRDLSNDPRQRQAHRYIHKNGLRRQAFGRTKACRTMPEWGPGYRFGLTPAIHGGNGRAAI